MNLFRLKLKKKAFLSQKTALDYIKSNDLQKAFHICFCKIDSFIKYNYMNE